MYTNYICISDLYQENFICVGLNLEYMTRCYSCVSSSPLYSGGHGFRSQHTEWLPCWGYHGYPQSLKMCWAVTLNESMISLFHILFDPVFTNRCIIYYLCSRLETLENMTLNTGHGTLIRYFSWFAVKVIRLFSLSLYAKCYKFLQVFLFCSYWKTLNFSIFMLWNMKSSLKNLSFIVCNVWGDCQDEWDGQNVWCARRNLVLRTKSGSL
jgi:hypothetical protein